MSKTFLGDPLSSGIRASDVINLVDISNRQRLPAGMSFDIPTQADLTFAHSCNGSLGSENDRPIFAGLVGTVGQLCREAPGQNQFILWGESVRSDQGTQPTIVTRPLGLDFRGNYIGFRPLLRVNSETALAHLVSSQGGAPLMDDSGRTWL
jgi:hypothetical protein